MIYQFRGATLFETVSILKFRLSFFFFSYMVFCSS
jgi:hypothetical protein